MKFDCLPSEFQEALPILKKIKAAGYEAYFVGGSVRDAILGRPIHDVDIASSSYPQETKAIFPKTVDVGIEHGTVLVLEEGREYEVTTFRTEEAYVDYRRPSSVHFVRSLEEDLKRRDFTINALAMDETGTVIDLFDGLRDLKNKSLKAVGNPRERFDEDALRVMRAFRFAASLNFELETKTLVAVKEHVPLLEKISVERSFIELDKLFQSDFWQKGLALLIESGAQDYLPGLKQQDQAISKMIDRLKPDFTFVDSAQAWAFLLICLGSPSARTFLKRWKTSVNLQKQTALLMDINQIREERDFTLFDLYHMGKDNLIKVEQLREAQGLPVNFEIIDDLDHQLAIHDKREIVINGKFLISELGFSPGPQLGQLLKEIETQIVSGRLANNRDDILRFIEIGGRK